MNENSRKKREWVKTAAIVFLSVMLVLTFFSNTIMNYSLPEVAAQYVQSGSITAKIRGTGVVESGDPYNVMVKETRKVSSVAVKVGDQVQKGDVLVYLEGQESEELKAAKAALDAAQTAYDAALLGADVNAKILNNLKKNISADTYRNQITAAQNEVDKAKSDVESWQARYDEVTVALTILPTDGVDTSDETEELNDAKVAMDYAKAALDAAENEVADIKAKKEYYETVSSGDPVIGELGTKLTEAQLVVIEKQEAYKDKVVAYNQLTAALQDKQSDGSKNREELLNQQKLMLVNLEAMKTNLVEKEAYLTELTADIATTLKLQSLQEAIDTAMEEVVAQEEKAMGGTVTAEIAGTVTAMNAVAGKEISAMEAVAILQPEGKGYTMSFSVTNEQAKRLSVGDVADLVNSWRYEDVVVTLASIKPDTTDPGQKKLLTFDVSGSVVAGQTLNISVGQKSANYDLIVPNSAIREDNNGKFVLTVESKSSPLGNRYVATRVDVEVIASDDTQSAINGALYGYEFIITTSNKPVEAGQLVRLPE